MFNKNKNNRNFDEETVQKVWEKGIIDPDYDSDVLRKDSCGALMERDEYGNTDHENGWEIDHEKPVSKGGSDSIANLQPLQWANNRHKGDDYPKWDCKIKAA